jgi:hypothetical protein
MSPSVFPSPFTAAYLARECSGGKRGGVLVPFPNLYFVLIVPKNTSKVIKSKMYKRIDRVPFRHENAYAFGFCAAFSRQVGKS